MPQVNINLKANTPTRQVFGRAVFLTLADLGAAPTVDVDIEVTGIAQEQLRGLRARDRVQTPGFEAVSFTAPVDCTISVIASIVDVRLNNDSGNNINATIVGPNPVPVATNRGQNAGAPLFVSGAILGDTPATDVTDNAGIVVAPAGTDLLAANVARLEAVIHNQGPDPVALGMPGLTWAKRAIVLNAGDVWIESRAAARAWAGVVEAGKTATVTVQERRA